MHILFPLIYTLQIKLHFITHSQSHIITPKMKSIFFVIMSATWLFIYFTLVNRNIRTEKSRIIETYDINFPVSVENFTDFEAIKSGQYGKVLKVHDLHTRKYFAIKITDENPVREIEYLQQLINHENIIKYFNSWQELSRNVLDLLPNFSQVYCIQLELCRGKDLQHWIENIPVSNKTEVDAKRIFFQLASGMEYMHSMDIIHRDLKPANILLLNEYLPHQKDLTVKIADLATCMKLQTSNKNSNRKLTSYVGTPSYMSPEMERRENDYHKGTDIFSMGIIFYQLLSSTMDPLDLTLAEEYRIRNATLPLKFFRKFPREYRLIKRMLSENPNKRPTASDVTAKIKQFYYSLNQLEL